jgi:hypothetical protein
MRIERGVCYFDRPNLTVKFVGSSSYIYRYVAVFISNCAYIYTTLDTVGPLAEAHDRDLYILY